MESMNRKFACEVIDTRRSAIPFEPSPFNPNQGHGALEMVTAKANKSKPKKRSKSSKAGEAIKSEAFAVAQIEQGFQPERMNTIDNLVEIAFLEKGVKFARSTGRIKLRTGGSGTGTMISPDLALTNNHVIGSTAEAIDAVMEFDFEKDINGKHKPVQSRRILELVSTDRTLDYAVVRLEGRPGDEFGFVDLTQHSSPQPDHPKQGYPVIVQHPGGKHKQVALTDNHVVGIRSPYFHYTTDTMPGSSGSLVYDQNWVAMGLHHAGRGDGRDASGRGKAINEGILMSSIVTRLQAEGILDGEFELYSSMRDLLKQPGSLPTQLTDVNIGWIDRSGLMLPLLQKVQEPEIALVAAAAAGVAAGAAVAHWGHVSSQDDEMFDAVLDEAADINITLELPVDEAMFECFGHVDPIQDLQFSVPASTTPFELFGYVYPKVEDPAYRTTMKSLVDEAVENSEARSLEVIVTAAGAFLAGVAAGAAAYQAGKD